MTINEAIKQLEELKKRHGGDIELFSYVQTGPDSYEWEGVTSIQTVMRNDDVWVDISHID